MVGLGLRPSPFSFHLVSNVFPDVGSVGRIEKKKPTKDHKKSPNRRPWYPRMTSKVNIHRFGLTKCRAFIRSRLPPKLRRLQVLESPATWPCLSANTSKI